AAAVQLVAAGVADEDVFGAGPHQDVIAAAAVDVLDVDIDGIELAALAVVGKAVADRHGDAVGPLGVIERVDAQAAEEVVVAVGGRLLEHEVVAILAVVGVVAEAAIQLVAAEPAIQG